MAETQNFNLVPDNEEEQFPVDFGETTQITINDFNKLENRPSYDGQLMTGETNIPKVPASTSELTNDSDYQTGTDVAGAISTHNSNEEAHPYIQGQIETKQDKLTAGANVQISDQNVISATDTTYTQGNGINISDQNAISVNTTVVATQQNLSDEVTNRENADIYLQGQIDAISASSDVVDIVGTYADLQNYDTQHLKDNDIIKVLQDETQGNATTYYRWSTATQTFTLIGQEGPYYTKAGADAQFVPQTRTVNGKALGSNITLIASDVSAVGTGDVVQTTGTSTTQIMSQKATTDALATKLNITDYVVDDHLANSTNPVQNQVLNGLIGSMPSNFFTADETVSGAGSDITMNGTIGAKLKSVELDGDTFQQTYSGKNLFSTSFATGTVVLYGDNGFTLTKPNTKTATFDYSTDLPAGTYTISGTVVNKTTVDYVGITVRSSSTNLQNLTVSSTGSFSSTFTTTEPIHRFYFYILATEEDGATITFDKLQVEAGSTASPFEPYTGGIPAPSPSYPEPISVVTGSQTVKVSGVNCFNVNEVGGRAYNSFKSTIDNTIKIEAKASGNSYATILIPNSASLLGKTCTISFGNITTNYSSSYSPRMAIHQTKTTAGYYANTTVLSVRDISTNYNISFTFPDSFSSDNNGFVLVLYPSNAGSSAQSGWYALLSDIQIELGESASSYHQYVSPQFYNIDLGSIELCKINNYRDRIFKSGDDWYVHKEITSKTFDGTEAEWTFTNNSNYPFRINLSDATNLTDSQNKAPEVFCNYYTPHRWTTLTYPDYLVTSTISATPAFRNIDIANLADWKTWLSTHNTTLYYPLAVQTNTKITDATLISELNAVYNAIIYLGTTKILTTATGTNLPVILDIDAYRNSLAGVLGAIERLSA